MHLPDAEALRIPLSIMPKNRRKASRRNMTRQERIHQLLTTHLKPQKLRIIDDSARHAGHRGAQPGGESHFLVAIIAEAFDGLSRLQRHRLIYQILREGGIMQGPEGIHALQIQAWAPEEESGSLLSDETTESTSS